MAGTYVKIQISSQKIISRHPDMCPFVLGFTVFLLWAVLYMPGWRGIRWTVNPLFWGQLYVLEKVSASVNDFRMTWSIRLFWVIWSSHYSVKVMFAELLFAGKMAANGLRWPFFPHKAAPHTSLSHYNAKYQITRNSRITKKIWEGSSHNVYFFI